MSPFTARGPIWLIGMMGAGKSTVARLLAARLGRRCIDLDRELEAATGCTIPELFAREGEAAFRAREATLALRLAGQGDDAAARAPAADDAVIATGGGTACTPATLRAMRRAGLVVWLRADVDDVIARIDLGKRPLLNDLDDPRARWRELERSRATHYRGADFAIERRGRSSEAVAEELADWLGAWGDAPLGLPGDPVELPVELATQRYAVVCDDQPAAEVRFAARLARHAPPGRTTLGLLTCETVARLHGERYLAALVGRGFRVVRAVTADGEAGKTLAEAGRIAEEFARGGLDRRSIIVALGGGAVTDLGGFIAAVLFRGVELALVPTTLLALADAAVGGKNGVNLPAGKNLIGAIHQPRLVWADLTTLATLDRRDVASGLAEVAKHALLAGGPLLARLEALAEAAAAGDPRVLAELIAASCRVKAGIVASDEEERNPEGGRALLNLGHTVGHALESHSQRSRDPLRHGEAVGLGLVAAARIGARLGGAPDVEARVVQLLAALGLPHDLDRRLTARPDPLAYLAVDKKREGARLRYVVLYAPGDARLAALSPDAVAALLDGASTRPDPASSTPAPSLFTAAAPPPAHPLPVGR